MAHPIFMLSSLNPVGWIPDKSDPPESIVNNKTINVINDFIMDEWKDEDMFWIDPANIPIIVDPNLKPNEVYMVSQGGTWTRVESIKEPKPKTRFEMIIEKTK